MAVIKRGRIYALIILVMLSATTILLVSTTINKRQEICRHNSNIVSESWQSPTRGMIEEILALGVFNHDFYISPYDDIFLKMSNRFGTDWRLMSAIAYTESRFTPNAESHNGAMGMMQIMPQTATAHKIPVDQLFDPEINIYTANYHFNYIEKMLKIPHSTPTRDRYALILASYNGGVGRVFDAMRLSRAFGEDPHSWRVVRKYLTLLRLPHYYERDDVYCGRFPNPYMTIRYTDDVLELYDQFCIETTHRLPLR